MFDRVLVPLDGSAEAERILPSVAWMAKRLNIPLTLLTVFDPHATVTMAHERGAVEARLQALVTQLGGDGVRAASMVVQGRPVEQILRVAEQRGCNLIALLTSTKHRAERSVLGGIADRVFHASQIPLLLVPPRRAERPEIRERPIDRLIVPLDGSPLAESALPYAEDLAQKLAVAVVLVRSVPFGGAYLDEDSPLAGEVEAQAYLNSIAANLHAEGFVVDTQVFGGMPTPHIVEVAGHTPGSLIILTTHGRSALARWFVGSITEAVVRAAVGPMLVIPRQYSHQYVARIGELLGQTPLFAELTEDDLQHLAHAARIRTYQAGEVIVREGEQATGCFTIVSGTVEVIKESPNAPPSLLATMGAGEIFGEMAVIDEHPRSATVRAVEATECVAIGRSDFMEALRRRPEIAVQLLPVLVRRVRRAEARGTA